jgi:hypothetical protein
VILGVLNLRLSVKGARRLGWASDKNFVPMRGMVDHNTRSYWVPLVTYISFLLCSDVYITPSGSGTSKGMPGVSGTI